MSAPRYWQQAIRELAAGDAVLRRLIRPGVPLKPGSRGDAFTTLARSIVGQQISVRAAETVWARLLAERPEMTPAALLAADAGRLRGCGLSGQKAGYLLDLAARFDSGAIDASCWRALDDEALIAQLTQVKGIGRWTAQMFLIFHLGRPDVLPLADLGLQRAISRHYNAGKPVTKAKMLKLGRAWSPWGSVATWYLWRSLDAAPVED